MSGTLLELENLNAWRGSTQVLRDIGLTMAPGERMAVIGDNGAGKSSLLLAIAGHLRLQGSLKLLGADITGTLPYQRARLGIGFSPEGRRVFAGMNVADNLAVAAQNRPGGAAEIYRLFPELERRQGVQAWQLSGGEQQMLAIGRALMGRPRLLLLDEPFLGLAPAVSERLEEALRAVRETGVSLLVTDQDSERVQTLCDHSIFLERGEIAT